MSSHPAGGPEGLHGGNPPKEDGDGFCLQVHWEQGRGEEGFSEEKGVMETFT